MSDFENIRQALEERERIDQVAADAFWASLSVEDKQNAFHAVVQRLKQGEIEEGGSYRYVLYDVFGFDLDMYVRGMSCGFMDLHNHIMTGEQYKQAYKSHQPAWEEDNERMDIIGQNGNDGLHYDGIESDE